MNVKEVPVIEVTNTPKAGASVELDIQLPFASLKETYKLTLCYDEEHVHGPVSVDSFVYQLEHYAAHHFKIRNHSKSKPLVGAWFNCFPVHLPGKYAVAAQKFKNSRMTNETRHPFEVS